MIEATDDARVVDQFVVVCEVSGGVTGYRRGLLRDKTGQTKLFPTMEAAATHALELERRPRYGTATFRYTAAPAWLEGGT